MVDVALQSRLVQQLGREAGPTKFHWQVRVIHDVGCWAGGGHVINPIHVSISYFKSENLVSQSRDH